MTHIPNVYLLIQVDHTDYVNEVLDKIPVEILNSFSKRVHFVQRTKDLK